MIYRRVERKLYTCKGEDLTRTVVHAEASNNQLKNLKDYKSSSPMYSQDNSIKEELKTREELQTLLSDEDIEIISVNDKFPTYLYHLTTEENLEKILKDGN